VESFPKGSFVKVRNGRWLYSNPSAALGSAHFIKEIDIREKDGIIHFGVDGFVATPSDGRVSLVLSQIGNTTSGANPVTEPTISLGIDRRHDSWSSMQCGYKLHDAGGIAPQIFCKPPLSSECQQPPPEICTKRRCLFAAEIRRNDNGKGTVELHVAVKPSTSASITTEEMTVMLQRTSAPGFSTEVARVHPGEMSGSGRRYRVRSPKLRLNALERKDGYIALDIIGKVTLPPLNPQDDLIVTISLGPDTFAIPATSQPWSTNANGNPVIKGGTDGIPFCPRDS
jgi:hypothetical protein